MLRDNGDDNRLNAMSSLSNNYTYLGNFLEAEKLYRIILEKKIKTLGSSHQLTLNTMINLASCFEKLGKLVEAEKLYKECYEKRKSLLGENHPNTLNSLSG